MSRVTSNINHTVATAQSVPTCPTNAQVSGINITVSSPKSKKPGKFQPVLQQRSLEKILFDDNYSRYMNAQTGHRDMNLQQRSSKDRTLPLKQSKTTPLHASTTKAAVTKT